MPTPLSLACRQARLTATRDFIDVGGGSLLFYTGSPAAKPTDPTSETLLGTVPLAVPSGSIGASGDIAVLTIAPVFATAIETGIVGWIRVARGSGVGVADLTVVEAPATGPAVMSAVQVYAGGQLQLASCVLTES